MKKFAALLTITLLLSISMHSVYAVNIVHKNVNDNQDGLNQFSELTTNFLIKLQNVRIKTSNRFGVFTNDPITDFYFQPGDIELKDDAFHGSDSLHYTEWWYFDAAFDNGLSAQISVRLLDIFNTNIFFAFSRLDIYENGELRSHEMETYTIDDFYASKETPSVFLNDKQVIFGFYEQESNNLCYYINIQTQDTAANLKFLGETEGWKGVTPGGEWSVFLPRAKVTGTISLSDEEVYTVKGIGYHDHNWNVTTEAALNSGWLWGKVYSESYTITWSNIMTSWFSEQPLIVLNTVGGGYMNIFPENIVFKQSRWRFRNGEFIPTLLILQAYQDNISINIEMNVDDIHYVLVMGLIDYWRYHTYCNGIIKVGDNIEEVNDMYMSELVRFY